MHPVPFVITVNVKLYVITMDSNNLARNVWPTYTKPKLSDSHDTGGSRVV